MDAQPYPLRIRLCGGEMKRGAFPIGIVIVSLAFSLSGCGGSTVTSTGDPSLDRAMASLAAKVPDRSRASVRVCESLVNLDTANFTQQDMMKWFSDSKDELLAGDDPVEMTRELVPALDAAMRALAAGDAQSYKDAGMRVATECTAVVSGERGK